MVVIRKRTHQVGVVKVGGKRLTPRDGGDGYSYLTVSRADFPRLRRQGWSLHEVGGDAPPQASPAQDSEPQPTSTTTASSESTESADPSESEETASSTGSPATSEDADQDSLGDEPVLDVTTSDPLSLSVDALMVELSAGIHDAELGALLARAEDAGLDDHATAISSRQAELE